MKMINLNNSQESN